MHGQAKRVAKTASTCYQKQSATGNKTAGMTALSRMRTRKFASELLKSNHPKDSHDDL
ncbi:hypothetical protein [Acidovorax sp. SUPP2539]|uniref:hypothetical protein n=1 Tax=Acidovorax sp. SUPP2539 TaxID=2920878 RepID=UPI0023DE2228|nr:hypothetical protein [Acidovorax sp. SUPP2539]GKS88018.1 hypothetical protein AVTE2539_01655 [Acidovorax sp. SUPP2539]